MRNLLLGCFVILVLFSSCKKEETDEEKPTIDSVLINESEMLTVSENVVSNGEQLTLVITVSDNVALSELSVEIHEATDGHEHERIMFTWVVINFLSLSLLFKKIIKI